MANYRNLSQSELSVATGVFQKSIDFSYVFIADTFLPGNNGVPVTMMFEDKREFAGVPIHVRYWFAIFWGLNIYNNGANSNLDTMVHELTHVWQGQHGIPFLYMIKSMIAQGKAIIQHNDRNKAYEYDHNNYQKWSEYNVEQQGNIVEEWYSAYGGKQSESDPRFTYIEKVIRAGNPSAEDIPPVGAQAAAGAVQGALGGSNFDPAVYAVQELLVRHGYRLKPDGLNGIRTINAIRDFQRKHGLKNTGVAGPQTLAKLKGN